MKRCAMLGLWSVVLFAAPAFGQAVRYVDDDAPAGGDGKSWLTAYRSLQDAIDDANGGGVTEIRVAGGTYIPSAQSDPGVARTETFTLVNGVAIRGGYRGLAAGGDPDERDISGFVSTLSGDLGVADDIWDNSYHVVTGGGTGATAELDGFTVTRGNSLNGAQEPYGGGMYNGAGSSPTVSNCSFVHNSAVVGGGMYNQSSGPRVVGCSFADNYADANGGGMHNRDSNPILVNCEFISNVSSEFPGPGYYSYGGGMSNRDSYLTLVNCMFDGNTTDLYGGAMYNTGGSATLVNCAFAWNWAQSCSPPPGSYCDRGDGGAIWNSGSSLELTNCTFFGNFAGWEGDTIYNTGASVLMKNSIVWDGSDGLSGTGFTVTYSCIEGGWPGTGNISSDPLVGLDLRLGAGSPCIDAGSNFVVPADAWDIDGDGDVTERTPLDLAGRPRFMDFPYTPDSGIGSPPIVDMGAFEESDCNGNDIPDIDDPVGDFDGNGYVDVGDIDAFLGCVSAPCLLGPCEPAVYADSCCALADTDDDGDVDLRDFAAWDILFCVVEGGCDDGLFCTGTETCVGSACLSSGDPCVGYPHFPHCDETTDSCVECLVNGDCTDGVFCNGEELCVGGACAAGSDPCMDPLLPYCDELLDACVSGSIRYVDDDAASGGDGQSWLTAYSDLQDAIDDANSGGVTEIRVAGGTYLPTAQSEPGVARTETFGLVNGVPIRGGYRGLAPGGNPDERDVALFASTLSGDLGVENDNSDNSYHVVTADGTDATAVLDGFTITAGNADSGASGRNRGGGMYNSNRGSPAATNCVFVGNSANSGGGMYNGYQCSPTVTGCVFSGNVAVGSGGGICNDIAESPAIVGCTFSANTASDGGGVVNMMGDAVLINCVFSGNVAAYGGGGVCNIDSHADLINCVFGDNAAGQYGGALLNSTYSSPSMINCTISGNSAGHGCGGICSQYWSEPYLANCIVWGNTGQICDFFDPPSTTTVEYSCVEGGHSGTGNIATDPLLGPDQRLSAGSPCIDAGKNSAVPADAYDLDGDGNVTEPLPVDLAWQPRFVDIPTTPDTGAGTPPIVDMGAFEASD